MRAAVFVPEEKQWLQVVPQGTFYSVSDVQLVLGVGGPQVYQYINRGTLPGYMVDGVTMVKHEDLVAYIDQRHSGGTRIAGDPIIVPITPKSKAATMAPEADLEDAEDVDLSFLDESG